MLVVCENICVRHLVMQWMVLRKSLACPIQFSGAFCGLKAKMNECRGNGKHLPKGGWRDGCADGRNIWRGITQPLTKVFVWSGYMHASSSYHRASCVCFPSFFWYQTYWKEGRRALDKHDDDVESSMQGKEHDNRSIIVVVRLIHTILHKACMKGSFWGSHDEYGWFGWCLGDHIYFFVFACDSCE